MRVVVCGAGTAGCVMAARLSQDPALEVMVVRGDRAVRVKLVGPEGPELVAADAVIVTLGTYATPAALLHSGIGPPAELARHGIAPVAPLEAVGRGMQDHPKVSYRFDPRRAGPALVEPLVPVPADRGPRGRPRAARLPGDALLGHRRGRPALHRPQRPGRRRPLAAGDRAPPEHRPGRPAGDRHGLVPRATDPPPSPPAGACSRWPRRRLWPKVLAPWPGLADPDHILRTVETFHHPVGSCRMGHADDPGAVAAGRVLRPEASGSWTPR